MSAKGSVIERHNAWYWRRREHGRDLPLERLGSNEELRSKKAAEKERDRRLMERNPLQHSQGKSITITALAGLYDQLRIKVAMKPASARSVRSRMMKHIVPRLGDMELMRIDALVTQKFIAALTAEQLSRRSIDSVLASLSCLLLFARQSGYPAPVLDRQLIRLPPHALQPEERWFTTEESQQIIDAAEWPWKAAFGVAAMLGLRCGEVLGLRWIDINFAQNIVHVRQNAVCGVIQTVKSKNSKADLPMPAPLEALLCDYEEHLDDTVDDHSTGLLFHHNDRPLSGDILRRELAKVLKVLDLPHGAMHAFRHGVVTRLLDMKVPIHVVKAIARHGRIETTQRYSHAQAESLRDAIDIGSNTFAKGNKGGTNAQDSTR
jgi:integrase